MAGPVCTAGIGFRRRSPSQDFAGLQMTDSDRSNSRVKPAGSLAPHLPLMLMIGLPLILLAGGLRIWWAMGAPARAAQDAAIKRAQAQDAQIQSARSDVA